MAVLNEIHYLDYLVGNGAVGAEHHVEIVQLLMCRQLSVQQEIYGLLKGGLLRKVVY